MWDFSQLQDHENDELFNEGPIQINKITNAVNTGSITTTDIDKFRQGVELTQFKHWADGIVKIHSGEQNHILRHSSLGMGVHYTLDSIDIENRSFDDKSKFSPVSFLRSQNGIDDEKLYPIVIDGSDQEESVILNGAIEPLTIRSVASFQTINTPFEAHDIKGMLMCGNEDVHLSTDSIVQVKKFEPLKKNIPFLEQTNESGLSFGQTELSYFIFDKTTIIPYNDLKPLHGTMLTENATNDSIIMSASLLLGECSSSDNYIASDETSSTAGFIFDNNQTIGTDSIAFGGMLNVVY